MKEAVNLSHVKLAFDEKEKVTIARLRKALSTVLDKLFQAVVVKMARPCGS